MGIADAPPRSPLPCQSTGPTPVGFWQQTAYPFPRLTPRGAYVPSSTTQGSLQPIIDSSFFASRKDHLCDAVHAPELPMGSATGQLQPRPHLCSAPSPVALLPSLLSSLGLHSRNHTHLSPTSGSASGEPDLRHRGKLYSVKRPTTES